MESKFWLEADLGIYADRWRGTRIVLLFFILLLSLNLFFFFIAKSSNMRLLWSFHFSVLI